MGNGDETTTPEGGSAPATDALHHDLRALSPGELFAGRYRVRGHVGRGGMGDVYEVLDEELQDVVALKVLARAVVGAHDVERFRQEVRLARRVTHRNVARTYDIGEHEGLRFITMERVAGESLRSRLARERALPLDGALAVARELAAGLAAAHDAGIVHRDLKPGNVLVSPSGRVVIIDFGIALPVEVAGSGFSEEIAGTLDYMAPEQLTGAPCGPAADVYALGMILFEMLAGTKPVRSRNALERARLRIARPAPDLRSLVSVPDEVAALVAACLSIDADLRPPASAIEETIAGLGRADPLATQEDLFAEGWNATTELAVPRGPKAHPGARLPTLAVLPWRTRGDDPVLADLALGVSEDLVDLLSRTRGCRVLAAGATRGLPSGLPVRAAGVELAADFVVEGSLARARDGLRISARLVDVESGLQLWADRFEGRVRHALELQDRIAQRVAEALRLQVTARVHDPDVPEEVVERYLAARALLRQGKVAKTGVLYDDLQRCVALAPRFSPVVAARALAAARSWLFPPADGRRWADLARRAVDEALHAAAHVPDTHVAASLVAEQEGRYKDARRALLHALELAPAYAHAHELLGRIEIEGGHVADGARRLRLAADLDPGSRSSLALVARAAALHGRDDAYARVLARAALADEVQPELLLLKMRVGSWRRRFDEARAAAAATPPLASSPIPLVSAYAAAVLASGDAAPLEALLDRLGRPTSSPRFATLLHQLAAEVCANADPARALDHLEQAVELVLLDEEWIERCPALDPIRGDARFQAARRAVASRVEALWSP